ncbi:MAG: toprim domain-containing protein [Chloroflexi bacterium]|nr:toprim domain-containing protein [Chloroflexota bacterium]
MVEGYVDVLISHQCGIKNVVAALGTALTERHVASLKKLSKNLVLALDPDAAGDEATLRGLEVAKQVFDKKAVPVPTWRGLIRYEYKLDADIRIITLPRGKDPDEVIREDAEQWRRLIDRAVPIVDYYFNVATSQLDLSQAKDKSAAVAQLLPIIKELKDGVEQAHYLQKLANLVQVSERSLEVSLSRIKLAGPSQSQPSAGSSEVSRGKSAGVKPHISTELYYLSMLLSHPEMVGRVVDLQVDELSDVRSRQAVVSLREYLVTGERFDWERFGETLDPVLRDYLQDLTEWSRTQPPMADSDVEREIDSCHKELRRRSLRERIRQLGYLKRDAEQAKDWEGVKNFIQKTEDLCAELALYEREGAKAWVWK